MKEEAEAVNDWGTFGGETNDDQAKPDATVKEPTTPAEDGAAKDDDNDWGAFDEATEEHAKADDTSDK